MAMQKTQKNVKCVSKCSLVRDPAFEFPNATNETVRLVVAAVAEAALGALGLSDLDDVDGQGVELKTG